MASETELILQEIRDLREDMRQDRRDSKESRKVMRDRIDDLSKDLNQARMDIQIGVHADAQVREEIKGLKKDIGEIEPAVEEWRRIKGVGLTFASLLAIGGVSFGAALMWAGDAVAQWIRHILRAP